MSDAERFWDDVHAGHGHGDEGPHASLVEAVGGVEPGTALELGCGTGPNAIWLAEQGWTVTGVDFSPVALERAAARAAHAGVEQRVRLERADLGTWSTDETFDLVLELFVHTPDDMARSSVRARAAERVRPGGMLLVVGHHTLAPWIPNPHAHALPTGRELVAELGLDGPGWEVRRAAEVPRTAREGGVEATVLDTVVHAVRA